MKDKLIVLLGNPGPEYKKTKHNIAWQIIDDAADISQNNWRSKFKGLFTSLEIEGSKTYFLKPETYMNLSGESVNSLCSFFKIGPGEVMVIQDELDLPFGTIVAKFGGGLAGHNGLKSISSHLGTNDFYRLRVGIGRPVHGTISDYVLSDFKGDDLILLENIINKTNEVIQDFYKLGFEKSFKKYNKKMIIT